jgi:hypothetical protein
MQPPPSFLRCPDGQTNDSDAFNLNGRRDLPYAQSFCKSEILAFLFEFAELSLYFPFMPRLLLIEALLFLLPFALYALYLALKRENPFTHKAWQLREIVWLGIAGFFLAFVLFGTLAEHAGENISGRAQVEKTKP